MTHFWFLELGSLTASLEDLSKTGPRVVRLPADHVGFPLEQVDACARLGILETVSSRALPASGSEDVGVVTGRSSVDAGDQDRG